jgi:cephalosporin hydroxylase
MVSGGFAYGYLFMSQHPNAPEIFQKFLFDLKPQRILEIGTFHGGLTLLLRDILDNIGLNNSMIKTYDINNQEFLKPLVKERKVKVETKNIFNDSYTDFVNQQEEIEISSFIKQPGVSLVMCDGGCKKCEYNLLARFLKEGDVIMAHDYAPDEKYFQQYMKDKIWNWLEISDLDIDKTNIEYNLVPYLQDMMQNVAWCSRISRGL